MILRLVRKSKKVLLSLWMKKLKNYYFKNHTTGSKKYYLYRHIRLDKNIPFYIGIGTTIDKYHRSKMSQNRSLFWEKIFQKTPILIEIIFEADIKDIILKKEIEFIKLYGRRNLKKGSLVNLTDGGDGTNNHKQSTESIQKRVDKISKQIYQYDLNGNFLKKWKSSCEVERQIGFSSGAISSCCRGEIKTSFDYVWSYIEIVFNSVPDRDITYLTENYLKKLSDVKLGKLPANLETMRKSRWKEVVEYENGIEIKRYCSSFEAERQLGLKPKIMNTYLKGKRKKIKNYEHKTWKYA